MEGAIFHQGVFALEVTAKHLKNLSSDKWGQTNNWKDLHCILC